MTCIMAAVVLAALSAGEVVTEELDVHPRPDWERPFVTLNGDWSFDFDPGDVGVNEKWFAQHAFSRKIHVPFPWQSKLSGIEDKAYQGAAWYQREIVVPKSIRERRIFLVFGAVDWAATVWLDGKQIAQHEGGYTPFEIDISDMVKPGKPAVLTVRAFDKTDPETPTGKQTGWYTPSGGIWQTVYLEFRGMTYLSKARVTPDIEREQATFDCEIQADRPGEYTLAIDSIANAQRCQTKQKVTLHPGSNAVQVVLPVKVPQLWTPDTPALYETQLQLTHGRDIEDSVKTYFGMRKVSRGVFGKAGHEYILLNNKPLYLRGALHQSFNPEGLYTHPSDGYMRNDYAKAKQFGFNFVRIHIKLDEPRALYWADKLGVLLMCDMPCFSKNTPRAHQLWEDTMKAALERDFNHPAIFAWCDFNETWGIGDGGYSRPTQEWVRDMYQLTKKLDPTRLVEDNSPCNHDHVMTDINSWHFYIDDYDAATKHVAEVVEKTAAGLEFNYAPGWKQDTAPVINSEYGGVGAGSGDRDVSWVFLFLTNQLRKYDKIGGYVYTELEDIEWEHNGFMNYDRSVKEFGYPAGITLAQLQSEDFPVLDCAPYQKVEAGTLVQIPVLISHWSERTDLHVRFTVDGASVEGTPWSTWLKPFQLKFEGESYRVTPLDTIKIGLPYANGLMNLVAEIIDDDGNRLGANYCVIESTGAPAWDKPDEYAAVIPVGSYSAYTFQDLGTAARQVPGKVVGHKAGYVEYQIKMPMGFPADAVKGCRLVAEIGAKADTERLDWPARTNPADCPQTDGKVWPTDVAVAVEGAVIKQVTIDNDFADARGVLSHAAKRAHGSHGVLADMPIEGPALEAAKQALRERRPVVIRFEVPANAAHQGGLALYGAGTGCWPSDPALVFTFEPETKKPKGKAKAVNIKKDSASTILKTGPAGHVWRYTTEVPGDGWQAPGFDDAKWSKGKAGFGVNGTPNARVGTAWDTPSIWMRTQVTLSAKEQARPLVLSLHHDEDVEVFVNGKPLLKESGYLADYRTLVLTPEQRALFDFSGSNTIAVHCTQTSGGQFVDLGIQAVD